MKILLPYWIAFIHRVETEKEFYFLKSLSISCRKIKGITNPTN